MGRTKRSVVSPTNDQRERVTMSELLCANDSTKKVLIIGSGFAPMEKTLIELGYSIERVASLPEKIKGMEFTRVFIDEFGTGGDAADLLGT